MNSPDKVISVENVAKIYRIWESPAQRLLSPFTNRLGSALPRVLGARLQAKAARGYRDFTAVENVSFDLGAGCAMGIIGRNGSGKSTLLQIIAGTLQPTHGQVTVRGRVAALLELGSGFNPEFTGRENVMLSGAIIGFSKTAMEAKFESIVEFADIGSFIDQPVKLYSSGMMLRLAFAVQTAVEPDVLIVDEALSVGDAPFQAKCFARIKHLMAQGCTILFVSHDIGTVRNFCQKAIWLKFGQVAAAGDALKVAEAYERECRRDSGMDFVEDATASQESPIDAEAQSSTRWLQEDRSDFEELAKIERRGNGLVTLRNFLVVNRARSRTSTINWDEAITAVYVVGSQKGYRGHFQLGLLARTLQGQEVLCCSDRTHSLLLDIPPGGSQVVHLAFQLPLVAGKYGLTAAVFLFPEGSKFDFGTYDFAQAQVADYVSTAAIVTIAPQFNLGIYGPVQMDGTMMLDLENTSEAS